MIYAVMRTEEDPQPTLYRFRDWTEYRRETWSPERTVEAVASTEIGKTGYTGSKWAARARLQELQDVQSAPGLSYGELATLQNVAERIARRYGLLREARENGLC